MQNKESKKPRHRIAISCDSKPGLVKEFDDMVGMYVNGVLTDTKQDVLEALIKLAKDSGKIATKEDLYKGEVSQKGTVSTKVEKVVELLMKYNRYKKRKGDERFFIDVSLIRTIAGTNHNSTKKQLDKMKAEIDEHHKIYGIDKRHNNKLRLSSYPSYQVTKARTIKVIFYDLVKDAGLLDFLGIGDIEATYHDF